VPVDGRVFRWFPNAGVVVLLRRLLALTFCNLTFGDGGSIFGRMIGLGLPFKIARRRITFEYYPGLLNFDCHHEGWLSAVTTCSVTNSGWKWHADVAA